MTKKDLIAPFLLAGIGLAFVFVSFMVRLSNGKSAKWVARKMKIGAILLSLSATVSCDRIITSCYDMPAPPNSMWINEAIGDIIEIQPDTGNVLNGFIDNRESNSFSFSVIDSNEFKVQNGAINAADGLYDSYYENFIIELDTTLIPGNYSLNLYDVNTPNQADEVPKHQYHLLIK